MLMNPLAVLIASVLAFVIGGAWYSALFAKPWMAATGLTEERLAKDHPATIFVPAFVFVLIAVANLGAFIGQDKDVAFGAFAGFAASVWVVMALGVIYRFERRPMSLLAVNAGYQVVVLTLSGAILGAMSPASAPVEALPVAAVAGAAAPADPGPVRSVTSEGHIDAPVAEVWRLFTTKEGVESWMTKSAEIDLRVGGAMRTNYEGTVGDPATITNTILALDPERMLALRTTGFPEKFPHREHLEPTWTVVYFEPVSETSTRVRVVQHGFSQKPEADDAFSFFEKGNAYTITALKQRAETPK